MFYNKTIAILGESEGYLDDSGIWHNGDESVIKTIYVDVQPYSKDRAYKDYGFTQEVTFRIYSEIDSLIKIGTKVLYLDDQYIINKVIEWDDYLEWMISDA